MQESNPEIMIIGMNNGINGICVNIIDPNSNKLLFLDGRSNFLIWQEAEEYLEIDCVYLVFVLNWTLFEEVVYQLIPLESNSDISIYYDIMFTPSVRHYNYLLLLYLTLWLSTHLLHLELNSI